MSQSPVVAVSSGVVDFSRVVAVFPTLKGWDNDQQDYLSCFLVFDGGARVEVPVIYKLMAQKFKSYREAALIDEKLERSRR